MDHAGPAPQARERGLRRAAVAPMVGRPGPWWWALTGVLTLVTLAGVGAFAYQVVRGIGVTGLNDDVFWGLYTVDLVAFIGFSYGGAMVSAILRLTHARWRGPISRIAEATALVTLAIGAVFPIVHLGRPERFWEMFTRFHIDSPISWDMVAIVTYLFATLVLFSLPLIPDVASIPADAGIGGIRARFHAWWGRGWVGSDSQRSHLSRALTAISIVIIPLAVMVHTVLSYAFSLTSRPGWHSTIFGPYFVIAAIYSGVAIVIVATAAYRRAYGLREVIPDRAIVNLGYIMVALGIAYAYLLFTEITTEGYVGEESAQGLLFAVVLDRYALPFWLFVIAGLAIPTLIVAVRRTRTATGITVAAALVVVAMYLKRFLMVIPPLTRPLIGEEWAGYSPSWVEWTVTAGATAAIPLLIMVLFRWVPVLAIHEMEEIEASGGDS
jgi:Ni/Fe-hydrogenase subunit HybB-like protein